METLEDTFASIESPCPEHRRGGFLDYIAKKARAAHIPVFAVMEITNRCNLICMHCYVPVKERKAAEETCGELTFDEIRAVFDDIVSAGCLCLKLTGGEPLLRADFCDIYEYAVRCGILPALFTNGTLVDSRIVALLKRLPPRLVEVSLYGATRETYERVTRRTASFESCIAGIRLLKEAGLPLLLKTPVFSGNHHEVDALLRVAEGMGLPIIFTPFVSPRLDFDDAPWKLNISPEEAAAIKIAQARRLPGGADSRRQQEPRHTSDAFLFCSAATNSFHIGADGTLSPCVMWGATGYRLPEQPFLPGWNGFLKQYSLMKLKEGHPCSACTSRSNCSYCPGIGLVSHDDSRVMARFCETARCMARGLAQP